MLRLAWPLRGLARDIVSVVRPRAADCGFERLPREALSVVGELWGLLSEGVCQPEVSQLGTL